MIVPASNPISNNIQVFFACIQSWSRIVDKIIWVSGGTDDGSLDVLDRDILDKLLFIENDITVWNEHKDISKGFQPNHINSMLNEGLLNSSADYTFVLLSDYILEDFASRFELEEEIKSLNNDFIWCNFSRRKIKIDVSMKEQYSTDKRQTMLFNMKELKKYEHFPYMFGISERNNVILDAPILDVSYFKSFFADNRRVFIPYGRGPQYVPSTLESIGVFVPDHFFYTPHQRFKQRILFYKYFNAYPNGGFFIPYLNLLMKDGLVKERMSKDRILELSIPNELKIQIERYYRPEMLGFSYHHVTIPRFILLLEKIIEKGLGIFQFKKSPYPFDVE